MGGEDNIRRFESEVENLWGKAEDGELIKIGKGFLLREADIEKALMEFEIMPDVIGDVRWIHRQDNSKDWYFVTPQKRSSFKGSVTFAAVGSVELWNPESGA